MDGDVEWPAAETRVQSALWRAEGHVERREYAHAARALSEAAPLAPLEERELVRGLIHLAAAGWRRERGEHDRGARQLAHARRRLAAYLPTHRDVDLAALLELVEHEERS